MLYNFGRENTLTFGIFSDWQKNICTKQQLLCEPRWSAQLLPASISSRRSSEWKLQVSNNLKNVNQVWAELLCLAQYETLLNSFSQMVWRVSTMPVKRQQAFPERLFPWFLYRFRLIGIMNRFYENVRAFLCCYKNTIRVLNFRCSYIAGEEVTEVEMIAIFQLYIKL